MKSLQLYVVCLGIFFCFFSTNIYGQVETDSSFVKSFERDNIIEIYPGVYATKFSFTNPFRSRGDFRLVANSSAYAGFYFNYKWLSVKYSWALPGTRLDKNVKLKFTDLQFRFNTNRMSFHPFYEAYNGLLFQPARRRRSFETFRDIMFTSAGTDLLYYFNASAFSHRAANYFSEMQLKTSSSFFILATPQWQQIKWVNPPQQMTIKDSTATRLLVSNPSWISVSVNGGYQHNFVFKKGLFSISPAIAAGGGLLKETNLGKNSIKPVLSARGWINIGYNGQLFYAYLNAASLVTQSKLAIRQMTKSSSDYSLTFGYRFDSYHKKIAGIL